MINNDLLISALYYAQLGWRVFPIVPKNKRPLISGWRQRATISKKQIIDWWRNYPEANIGVATGKESGFFVLDIDVEKHGDWSLQGLERLYCELPDTIASYTGNGGRHLFFAYPDRPVRNSVSKLGHGLDIRGDGGYVLAPPSHHPNGRKYQWIAPPWLIRLSSFPNSILASLLRKPRIPTKNGRSHGQTSKGKKEGIFWVNQALHQVHTGGGRNDTCFWLACQLRDWGFSDQMAWKYIRAYAKRVPARNHPFTIHEAERTWENVFSTQRRRPALKVDE